MVRDGSGLCVRHQGDKQIGKFADPHRGSRHDRGYGRDWDIRRVRILRRDDGLCQECLRNGRATAANHVDHIKPKCKGGSDDDSNLQSLCVRCHKIKTAREAREARAAVGVGG